MKSLFVVGTTVKEQFRIKSFLEKDFELDFNPSVHNALDIVKNRAYDALLFDTDNIVPLDLFMTEIKKYKTKPLVSVLASKVNVSKMKRMLDSGVISVIKKPCSKKGLLKGINETFDYLRTDKVKQKPVHRVFRKEVDTWIALKKDAVITQLKKGGFNLQLPTPLGIGTKVLIKNANVCRMIRFEYDKLPRFEMEVKHCKQIGDFLFDLELAFNPVENLDFQLQLSEYVDKYAAEMDESNLSKTILVAETDPFTRDFYQKLLFDKGYQLKFAADGVQALKTIESESIDLLITELMLHRLSGLELIDELKDQNIEIPIIVASGESSPQIAAKLSSKVDTYLLKPFESKRFIKSVEEIMNPPKDELEDKAEKNDTHVKVYLETNVLVTFSDHFQVLDFSQAGLTFKRVNPIAPGTSFLMRKDALISPSTKDSKAAQYLELETTRCQFNKSDRNYVVHSKIILPSHAH